MVLEFLRENFSNEVIIAALATFVVTIVKLVDYVAKDRHSKADNMHANFNSTLNGLKSDSETERITSAILLRRYINDIGFFKRATPYKKDALNVISSLLRISPCGEFQKTLSDSLSFTKSVCSQDFQNAIIKLVNNGRIDMSCADFYKADLSYASINNAKCINTVFCGCNMRETKFRNCDLRKSDFRYTNLEGTEFFKKGEESKLEGAKFEGATNIPESILKCLDNNGIYHKGANCDYVANNQKKVLFISCLGNLSPRQGAYINALKLEIKKMGIETIQFSRSMYRDSGQISMIQSNIAKSNGVVIVGFKNILVKDGEYRPSSSDKKPLKDVWLSAPWNHIEAGIASSMGKPILVIHQSELKDGIFDKSINDSKIAHIDIQESSDEFKKDLRKWIQENV